MNRWKLLLLCAALSLASASRAWAGAQNTLSGLSDGVENALDSDDSALESKTGWGGSYDGSGFRPAAGIVVVQPQDPDYDHGVPSSNGPDAWDGSVVRPDRSPRMPSGDRLELALAQARSQPDPNWQKGFAIRDMPAPDLKDSPNSEQPASEAANNVRKGAMAVGAGVLVFMTLTPLCALGGAALGSVSGLARAGEQDQA